MTINLEEAQRIGEQLTVAIHEGRALLKDLRDERRQLEASLQAARRVESLTGDFIVAFQTRMDHLFETSAATLMELCDVKIHSWLAGKVRLVHETVEEESLKAVRAAMAQQPPVLRALLPEWYRPPGK